MLIDPELISPEALNSLITEYCLRDWGLNENESPLESRQKSVTAALEDGSLVIIYSQHLEPAQIVAASEATQTS